MAVNLKNNIIDHIKQKGPLTGKEDLYLFYPAEESEEFE